MPTLGSHIMRTQEMEKGQQRKKENMNTYSVPRVGGRLQKKEEQVKQLKFRGTKRI